MGRDRGAGTPSLQFRREKPEQILELGCGIGTSACYMAAALAELGRGRVTSIDRMGRAPIRPPLLRYLLTAADADFNRFSLSLD